MADDPTTEAMIKVAEALAKESYGDVVKPSAKVLGETLASVVRFTSEIVKLFADGGTAGVLRLRAALTKALETVPVERQIAPPANIVGPATVHYLVLGDGVETEDLREMFVKLLRAAMDSSSAPDVHPAFVSVITQLTPAEAWLLRSIDRFDYGAVNMFRRVATGRVSLGIRTTLGKDLGIEPKRLQQQVSNLARLGVLSVEWSDSATDESELEALEQLLALEFPGSDDTSSHGGAIRVTAFGQQFLDTCVRLPPVK